MIKFYAVFFLPIIICFSSCGNNSPNEIAKDNGTETNDCICKAWGSVSDTSGKKTEEAFRLLDHYLLEFGYLGKGTVEDYYKFAIDTTHIIIPTTADSIEKLRLALYGGNTGSPDAGAVGKCFDKLYNDTRSLDANDPLRRISELLYSMRSAGAIDEKKFYAKYFENLSEADFNKPPIKNIYYLMLLKRIDIKDPVVAPPVDSTPKLVPFVPPTPTPE